MPPRSIFMSLKQKLQEDLKAAMKGGEKLRTMALRGILSEVTRVEKDVRHEATDDEVIQVIKRERARRAESLEFARKANRADLIEQNETEAKVLDSYLPAAASSDEVRAAIAEIIAGGAVQMGPVMKALRERFGSTLDGKVASDLVKQALAPR
jgi:uncharacterized protein